MKNKILFLILLNSLFSMANSQTISVEQKPYFPYGTTQPTYSYSKNLETGQQSISVSPLPGITISGTNEPTSSALPKLNQQIQKNPNIETQSQTKEDKPKNNEPFVNEVTLINKTKTINTNNNLKTFQEKNTNIEIQKNKDRVNLEYSKFINAQ